MKMKTHFFYTCLAILASNIVGEIARPRGIPISKSSLYLSTSGGDFTCLDGSAVIPFDRINDDYCDCKDASDEPGTSACPNGSFHCTNAGYRPKNLPSVWVNDGICDCCDGTDEYESDKCPNTCRELGRQMREEEERMAVLIQEGHQVYLEYVEQGRLAKIEKEERRGQLEKTKEEAAAYRSELEVVKEEAEKPETEAKDQHKKAWDEVKEKQQTEREEKRKVDVFIALDVNQDGLVTVDEMQRHLEFDIDSNGEVSYEEAKEYLEDNDQMDMSLFAEKVWPNIKEIYRDETTITEPEKTEEDSTGEDKEKTDDDQMPEYDDVTKELIAVADKARAEFDEADKKFKSLESELDEINKFLALDLGPNLEYYPLKGQCFEYTDSQYTYKMCPFERATQRGKHGGMETSLGQWGSWDGPDNNLYSVMKFDRGQNCWNGPDRSVRVLISCGKTNEVFAASEPNRCEYEFKFSSPAACSKPPKKSDDSHDEL